MAFKLIEPSYEIIDQKEYDLVSIKKHIERCARVSYKSEDKITEDSYKKFVSMLIERKHYRPIEFGTVCLKMPIFEYYKHNLNKLNPLWSRTHLDSSAMYLTTNYRALIEHFTVELPYNNPVDIVDGLINAFGNNHGYNPRHTVHFIIDRGTMDEFRTHITLSHLAESTRYCNYSKDKFDNSVTFIKHPWMSNNWPLNLPEVLYETLGNCADIYMQLLKFNVAPQMARAVLPLSIKSELISCGFEDAWENFFSKRAASDAHPDAQEITIPLMKDFESLKINQ